MTDLIEDEDDGAPYVALINAEGQYSLWQQRLAVPAGWAVQLPGSSRQNCLAFIEANWTDMRPRSLVVEQADAPASTS